MEPRIRVLVVDDEPAILRALQRLLTRRGFEVETASSGLSALEHLRDRASDVIISDFKMPGMNGTELLCAAAAMLPKIRRILLSGCAERVVQVDAVFIPKPFDEDELLRHCRLGRLP